jgi:hypothetical protein
MADSHRDAIRALQPYRNPESPDAAKLVTLAALNNLDKHQVILSGYTQFKGPDDISTFFLTLTPDEVEYVWNIGTLFEPGAEILRIRTLAGQPITGANLRLQIAPAFGDPRNGLGQLRDVRAYCVAIVESFAPAWA